MPNYKRAISLLVQRLFICEEWVENGHYKNKPVFRSCSVFLFQLETDGFESTIFRVCETLKNLD